MVNDKEVLARLLKIATNQQKIITKLAQVMTPPQKVAPQETTKREAEAILTALPHPVRAAVEQLEVHPSNDPGFTGMVKVRFIAGKSSPMAFEAVQKTVEQLQNSNVLSGQNYKIQEVA